MKLVVRTLFFLSAAIFFGNCVYAGQSKLSAIPIGNIEYDIQQYRGKIVMIDFWASWCGPCRESFPWMNRLNALYENDDLVILAINLDAERSLAEEFLVDVPVTFSVLYDPSGTSAEYLSVEGMPSTYFFDRDGKFIERSIGFTANTSEKHEALLTRLIKGNAK